MPKLDKPATCKGCPLYEPLYGKEWGFTVPSGTGKSGVLVVAEAPGKDEELEGKPLIGESGRTLFQELGRVGVSRDDLTIYNVIACRPPDNKLVKQPYEKQAIEHCSPNLDKVIANAKLVAKQNGKTFTIVCLGQTAFKRIMGLDPIRASDRNLLKHDYIGYPFWNDKYGAWVYACDHPAYLLRGKTHLWPLIQFVFSRALEVADKGLKLDTPNYELDPTPESFKTFKENFKLSLKWRPDNPLSYDIETPYKKKAGDEDELQKAEDEDHTILRISFSFQWKDQIYTCSIKWSAEYMADIEELFRLARFVLGWNNDHYDNPRVSHFIKIEGLSLDGMIAWHILQSNLFKRLGFVTPFNVLNTLMWKHLSDENPAYYNAKDAHMTLLNWFKIKENLINANLWHVYERHWIRLSEVLNFMSAKGVLRDEALRAKTEQELSAKLDEIEAAMEAAVPKDARKWKILKKKPKDSSSWEEGVQESPIDYCSLCGLQKPKRWKKHTTLCSGKDIVSLPEPQPVWKKPLEFKISNLGLKKYQASLKHQAILSRRDRKVTFNEDAIVKLMKDHKDDPLYPLIIRYRKVQKLLSTYIGVTNSLTGKIEGGMPIGPDGRIHTVYGRNANTLRFTSEEPNLQNLPRVDTTDPENPANIVRNLIYAE